jgi:hypothetical protein
LKLDALVFVVGTMFGIFLFGETVEGFWRFYNTAGFHGRWTIPEWLGLPTGVVVVAMIVMALGMFWGGEKLERMFTEKRRREDER